MAGGMRPMRQAGYRPAAMVAKNARASAVTTLVRSTCASACVPPASVGSIAYRARRPMRRRPPIASPSTAPIDEMTPTSTRCWKNTCRRLAPRARRPPAIAAFFRHLARRRRPPRAPRAPPHAGDRRVVQELREQQAHGVQQADCEESEGETDEHAVVVLDDLVVDQPLVHFRQAVVERALETPGLFLSRGVVVNKGLEALLRGRVRQLDPHLEPDGLGSEELLVSLNILRLPALRIAGAVELERDGPAERDVDVLRLLELAVVDIVEGWERQPVIEHTDDPELPIIPVNPAADAVLASEELVVHLLRQHEHWLRALVRGAGPAAAVLEGHGGNRGGIFGRDARERAFGLDNLAIERQHADRLVHDELALRDIGLHQRRCVAVGELPGGELGLVLVVGILRIPTVECHGVEHVVLP